MKYLKIMMVLATVTLAAVACGPKNTQNNDVKKAPKTLVVYYSQTSNTKAVAVTIAMRLGAADLEEIVPVEPYENDFQATVERGKRELDEGILPEIQPLSVNVADYDLIFIGYPVWFGTYAQPVATFLNQVDLTGKKVVPFCTFGSGGLESSIQNLAKAQPNANILQGYGVRAARLNAMPKEIDQFLKAGGFIQGEYTQLGDFSDQQPVSNEEASIFDAAVGDYPMIHAKAESVGKRSIPGGTEYLFVAVDLPREDRPDLPPAGMMKVYVTVMDDKAPEFTRVVR